MTTFLHPLLDIEHSKLEKDIQIFSDSLWKMFGKDNTQAPKIVLKSHMKMGSMALAVLPEYARCKIIINKTYFVNNQKLFYSDIIAHEIAHVLAFCESGCTNHGKAWKNQMKKMGLKVKTTYQPML